MRSGGKLLLPPELVVRRRIVAYLRSDDPRLVKHAVQTLCQLLERGRGMSLSDEVRTALSRHQFTSDLYVKRWLSKLFGLLGDVDYLPWVRDVLLNAETDLENRTWAVAAMGALQPHADVLTLLRALDLPSTNSAYPLAIRYFRPEPWPLGDLAAARAMEASEALSPMWVALLHSQARDIVDTRLVGELTVHHDPRVAEYSVWSLVQHPHGVFAHARVAPDTIPAAAVQLRRWWFRLLGKDRHTLHAYADLICQTLDRADRVQVREGVALAIRDMNLAPPLAQRVAEWYVDEPDELVLIPLSQHLRQFAGRCPAYREALDARPFVDSTAELLADYPSSEFAVLIERPAGRPSVATPPSIVDSTRTTTYIVGMDTVSFSALTDSDQVSVLRQLLAGCADDEEITGLSSGSAAYLITGDGLIIGFRGDGRRIELLPLNLALRLRSRFHELHGYQTRFGVHAGPAQWLAMSDGSTQLIGHAVNWTARVMNAASGGQVLVSQQYHESHAHPARDYIRGVAYTKLDPAPKTKHGEDIPALEVNDQAA